MERGEPATGEVIRVEIINNTTINGRHPRRVVYRYGQGRECSMTMAMNASASQGQTI